MFFVFIIKTIHSILIYFYRVYLLKTKRYGHLKCLYFHFRNITNTWKLCYSMNCVYVHKCVLIFSKMYFSLWYKICFTFNKHIFLFQERTLFCMTLLTSSRKIKPVFSSETNFSISSTPFSRICHKLSEKPSFSK